jgi:carbon storage regulator CsrA
MLVLSRRPSEAIVVPNLGLTIRVVRVKGNTVQLGIDAPPDVKILRQELETHPSAVDRMPSLSPHSMRNRLNKLNLHLHLLQQQWDRGLHGQARMTLDRLFEMIDSVSQECGDPQPRPERAGPMPNCRTLIVDDDSNERELLAGLLQMHGCACETAADGLDALAYLESHERPDVMLLDLVMPRCNGAQVVDRVRHDPRYAGLKVFAISGTAPESMGIHTGPDGVDAWFPKPLNPRKLWEAIELSRSTGEGKN